MIGIGTPISHSNPERINISSNWLFTSQNGCGR
jgi:hypothetical protein